MVETFSLRSKDEVVRFEMLLDKYTVEKCGQPIKYFSLTNAYNQLSRLENGGRLFTALLDLHLNFLLLFIDMTSVSSIWNSSFSGGKLEGGSILDTYAKFLGKMDIHRFSSSYILRYRALWDKIMGFLILLYAPSEYERFHGSKSRKKAFRNINSKNQLLDNNALEVLENFLTEFDNQFRTAEAHGTGALRKYTLNMEPLGEDPFTKLFGSWNAASQLTINIGKHIEDGKFVQLMQTELNNSIDD